MQILVVSYPYPNLDASTQLTSHATRVVLAALQDTDSRQGLRCVVRVRLCGIGRARPYEITGNLGQSRAFKRDPVGSTRLLRRPADGNDTGATVLPPEYLT